MVTSPVAAADVLVAEDVGSPAICDETISGSSVDTLKHGILVVKSLRAT